MNAKIPTKQPRLRTRLAEPLNNLPRLRFTPWSWAKLLHLRDAGLTEVGGFGITDANDATLITDVRLVRQHCTSVTVAFCDDSVADFFDE
jgi:hypothetical protein